MEIKFNLRTLEQYQRESGKSGFTEIMEAIGKGDISVIALGVKLGAGVDIIKDDVAPFPLVAPLVGALNLCIFGEDGVPAPLALNPE